MEAIGCHDGGGGVEDDGGSGYGNGVMLVVMVRLWQIDTTKVAVMVAALVK